MQLGSCAGAAWSARHPFTSITHPARSKATQSTARRGVMIYTETAGLKLSVTLLTNPCLSIANWPLNKWNARALQP